MDTAIKLNKGPLCGASEGTKVTRHKGTAYEYKAYSVQLGLQLLALVLSPK